MDTYRFQAQFTHSDSANDVIVGGYASVELTLPEGGQLGYYYHGHLAPGIVIDTVDELNGSLATLLTDLTRLRVQFDGDEAFNDFDFPLDNTQMIVWDMVWEQGVSTYAFISVPTGNGDSSVLELAIPLAGPVFPEITSEAEAQAAFSTLTQISTPTGELAANTLFSPAIFANLVTEQGRLIDTSERAKEIIGEDGDDDISGLAGRDTIDGGAGYDTARYSNDESYGGLGGITVDMDAGMIVDGFGDIDSVIGIERVVGTSFNDSFSEGSDKVRFHAGAGDDTVYGSTGVRSVFDGGAGTDHLSYENLSTRVIIDVDRGLVRGGVSGRDTFEDFEEITGSQTGDFMVVRTGSGWVLDGHDGNDVLKFKGEATGTLEGGEGNDKLVGLEGNDELNGGAGDDSIFGNGGDDTISTGTGTDYAYGGRGNDMMVGGDERDFLRGNRGEDMLLGNGGNDDLEGGAGNDLLSGGAGTDVLQGGNHDDTLIGGADTDYLYGEGGNNVFVFLQSDGAQTDHVQDFADGSDLIDLTDYAFTDVSELGIIDYFGKARIDLGNDQVILLRDVAAADLSNDDFFF